MAMAKIKYAKRLEAERDNAQLSIDGSREHIRAEQEERARQLRQVPEGEFLCPFCLFKSPLSKFTLIYNHAGIPSRATCPDCNNTMMTRSLTKRRTTEEYAEWCFNYSMSGFWQKVPFDKWKERLYKLNMSHQFWTRYRELKGAKSESYEEHLMRQQMEYAEEHGEVVQEKVE